MKKLFIIFIISVGFFTPFYNTHAIGGILGCSASGVAGSLAVATTSEVPVQDAQTDELAAKECILDGLVPVLRQALITTITNSIVEWINSGFDGAPAFVTDLNGFLDEVADNTELEFILGDELGFLCSPFQLQVRLALAVGRQPFHERVSCSLGEVSDNIEGFLSGDFSQGGWPAWFRLHIDTRNSPYGAYASAKAELQGRKEAAVNEQLEQLRWGSGFFSKKECVGAESIAGDDGIAIDTSTKAGCNASGGELEIVTPGAQINEQLGRVLGSGLEQLELADELDEIINALLAQLSQQIFTSADGLRGLSNPSSSSSRNNRSYLGAIQDEVGENSIESASSILIRDINGAIRVEEIYQSSLERLITDYQISNDGFVSLYQCYQSTNSTSNALVASSTLSTQITPQLKLHSDELNQSYETVSSLISIRGQAQRATSASALNNASDAYDSILASGVVHTNADVALLNEIISNSQLVFEGYDNQIALGLAQCGGI